MDFLLPVYFCYGPVARVPHRPMHEKQMTLNACETRMTLTKEKNNTHKQRTLPNDEHQFKGSNKHETHFRHISADAKKLHSFLICRAYTASCDRGFNIVIRICTCCVKLCVFYNYLS